MRLPWQERFEGSEDDNNVHSFVGWGGPQTLEAALSQIQRLVRRALGLILLAAAFLIGSVVVFATWKACLRAFQWIEAHF